MIFIESLPVKNLGLWSLLILCSLIFAYVVFVAVVSVWVGLSHLEQDGFWMPFLAGALLLTASFWLFLSASRFVLNKMKEKDVINV